MTSNEIQRYKSKSVPTLIKIATKYFNAWIRQRDRDSGCISCDSHNTSHASHFYSAGHYPSLRFNEFNCHSSCVKCNTFLHGNLLEYRKRLLIKIGQEQLNNLELDAAYYKRNPFKWDRYSIIDIILRYK